MSVDPDKLLKNIENAKKEWESTFDSVGDIITLHDKDYRIVRCNKALINKLNLTYNDVIGKKCYEVFHNSDGPVKDCPMAETIKTKRSVTREIEAPRLGGIFNISSYPRINENGEFVGAVQVARDVTELKRAEAYGRSGVFITGFLRMCRDFVEIGPVLELTTSALAEHLNVSRASIWFFDNSGNLECRKLFEHPKGSYSSGMVHFEKNCPVYIKSIMDGNQINSHDARTDTHTKELLDDYLAPLNIFSVLDIPIKIRGKISGVLCLEQTEQPRYWHKDEIHFVNAVISQVSVAIDRIAERELADNELRASELRLRNIIEKNADGIVVLDENRIVRFVNPAAESLFGLKSKELKGRLFEYPVKADETTEIEIVQKLKEKAIVEMRVVRIKWEKEDANLALLRDVTKQRKSEEEIRKYSKNLETSNKELVKMHADVEKHRRELQRLSEKIVNVQEEERKNLSRELHDHTGQALIALKTNLEVIDKLLPEDAVKSREWLRDSKQFLIQTINEVRSLSFYLRPPMLDELGLAPTIESYAKDYANRTKIVVNVESSSKVEGLRPEQELSLYRMVQEALTNIAKHSGAKTVQIKIYKEDSKLVLSVKDDGKGFDIDDTGQDGARERGVGLLGMRERFLSTGAEFRVHSKEGEGTALIAKYQIKN